MGSHFANVSNDRSLVAKGIVFWLFAMLVTLTRIANADVIVLANRTATSIQFQFQPLVGETQVVSLPSGESTPMFLDGRANLLFNTQSGAKRYQLDSNSAYYFGRGPGGRVDLQKIGLGEDATTMRGRSLPGSASRAPIATIPVKMFVDEEEPSRQAYWERRPRRRIESASEILEKHCRVRFRVTAVGTWNSDNATNDFNASLGEFEREAVPAPAQLAIGFTSQWRWSAAGPTWPARADHCIRTFSCVKDRRKSASRKNSNSWCTSWDISWVRPTVRSGTA